MKSIKILTITALLTGMLVSCAKNDQMTESYDSGGSYAPTPAEAQTKSSDMPADVSAAMEEMEDFIAADSVTSLMSSSAAVGSPNMDTSHKFIRNANLRFRVNQVRTATFQIEKITAKFGGYVSYTGLQSTIDNVKHTKVSDDSTLVTTYYTVHNNMTLRVPSENLDSTLRTLGSLVVFLDYRNISVQDVTLMILRERLAARRLNGSTRRLENLADDNGKIRDRAAVEESIYNKQTMADESMLRTLELKDQIALSTVNLDIYQNQAWSQEMIANEKSIDAYKPGFFHDIGQALEKGWSGLKSVVVALFHLWPLLLIVAIVLTTWRVIRRRRKAKQG